jgi:Uma2 family endonuclease
MKPRALVEVTYAGWAQEYLRSLPPEHFMEATSQATQRKITLESLDLVHARRPEVQVFNELLVQYPRRGERRPGQVVPDNMVVVCDQPLAADGSYDLPLQPVGPLLVLDYVSKHNRRKDYDDNFDKYEKGLKVPYFLRFHAETKDLTLYHHTGKKYTPVRPNGHGRYPVPDLEIEVGLREGWVRFWFRGQLLLLPAEILRELDKLRQAAQQESHRPEQEKQRADEARQRADQLQELLERERQERLAADRELKQLRAQARPNRKRRPNAC